jgi:hypothetical protein
MPPFGHTILGLAGHINKLPSSKNRPGAVNSRFRGKSDRDCCGGFGVGRLDQGGEILFHLGVGLGTATW